MPPAAAAAAAASDAALNSNTDAAALPALVRNGVSLERRIKQELIEQGLLSDDDDNDHHVDVKPDIKPPLIAGSAATVDDRDDEILGEIQRVRTELATIAEYNYGELHKLRQQAKLEMRRLEVKRQLDVVDQEIVRMYDRVAAIRQAKRRPLNADERADVFRLTGEQRRLSDLLETFATHDDVARFE